MGQRMLRLAVAVAVATALIGLGQLGAADDKPKYDIKTIMAKAHKGKPPLCAKVVKGEASDAEKKELYEYYVALAANKCPKGDEADWKKRTEEMVAAAKKIADGSKDKADLAALSKAIYCKGCHDAHR
ncbi:MAG: hypothetical protein NZ700_10030 [Gemmataceae bacterium]|nr:hypothetical protein [Gemmataceae bacterium]MDW8264406.1 hypothetical protein [Gemmataceae bacterium]